MNIDIVNTMPVVEFAESILGIELCPQQVALLKDYYGEPLSVWERQVIEAYETEGKGRPQLTDRYLRCVASIISEHIQEGTLDKAIEGGVFDHFYSSLHSYPTSYPIISIAPALG